MVLVIAFILLVSLAVSAVLQALAKTVGSGVVGTILELILSIVVSGALFAGIFKVLPDVRMRWREVWIGGFFTGLLFTLGKFLLGLYLSHATSAYGAAASFAALLIFIYYSSQILYLGAEFTQMYAKHSGNPLRPANGAVKLTEEERVQQGMPKPETVAVKQAVQPPENMDMEACPTQYAQEINGQKSGSKILPALIGLAVGRFVLRGKTPPPQVVRRKIIVVRTKPRSVLKSFQRGWQKGVRNGPE